MALTSENAVREMTPAEHFSQAAERVRDVSLELAEHSGAVLVLRRDLRTAEASLARSQSEFEDAVRFLREIQGQHGLSMDIPMASPEFRR